MTTAHRPTWKAAVGRSQESKHAPSSMRSILDEPSHTKLKLRSDFSYIDKASIIKASLEKLQEVGKRQSAKHQIGKRLVDERVEEEGNLKLLENKNDIDVEKLRMKYDDSDYINDEIVKERESGEESTSSVSDTEGSENYYDSDEEEILLQQELEKIRSEREKDQQRKEAEATKKEKEKQEEEALVGNPLLDYHFSGKEPSAKLKRHWNDDVVFRNQARDEPKYQKRFINDTVRNDFHKRFLDKFIQ